MTEATASLGLDVHEEEDLLEEFQFYFTGQTSSEDEVHEGTVNSSVFRSERSTSVWENEFSFSPTPFEGLAPAPPEPTSALFRFVKKNVGEVAAISEALANVRVRDNSYRGLISTQRNIPYLKEEDGLDKHKLDVYFPLGAGESLHKLPLVIHFHGGGWVRGDRRDEFRGAPAVCRHYSKQGVIAVAPSYRLVDCPGHMEDAVAAVTWTIKHLVTLGANPSTIFLSGHSAGGNIAANLVCGPWLDDILQKYQVTILGAVCISGVYSLLNPLGGAYAKIKNKGFDKLYRLQVFGSELDVLVRHSPVAQLRLMLGEAPYAENQCKLCNIAYAISNWIHDRGDDNASSSVGKVSTASTSVENDDATNTVESSTVPPTVKSLDSLTTAFLVMNAESDIGLETDGQRFVELLRRVQSTISSGSKNITPSSSNNNGSAVCGDVPIPQYHLLPGLGHATITLDEKALAIASDFVLSTFQQYMHK